MNRRDLPTRALAGGVAAPAAAAARLPNLVLLFADDLGYGDLSCYGHPTIVTPNLDRMAREGMKFTQFYSAAPLCTPSRAALMTGRLPIRSGLTRVLFPWSDGGIFESEITLAQMLKQAGYANLCVGKWHLGHRPRYLPTRHGFDDYFGIPYSNDMSKATNPRAEWADQTPPTPLLRGEKTLEQEPDQRMLTRRYTEAAADFIRQSSRAGAPFFLYLPYTAPHWPLAASDRFRGTSLQGLFGDVVEELDWSVGEVLRVLREQGIERNTLVIFTSDNGAEGGSAGPFRDGKGTPWEGGLREPCLAWWPGKVPAGVTTPAFASTMDRFPTFAGLSGQPMPEDRVYDGADLAPVLFRNSPGREPLFYYYADETLQAVRKGRWKLHLAASNRKMQPPPGEGDPPLLFDVQQDISERRNVARSRSDIVKELQQLAARHVASMKPGPPQR